MKDYIELTKPRVTWLILATTAIGYFFGARAGWSWWTLLHTAAGTCLIASGTAALNQWYEREADARMKRTARRPIPAGRVSERRAYWFGIALSVAGFAELAFGANLLTGLLGAFTLAVYLFAYTPLKQRSPHSTTVGAIPGAMPPLIGFAGAAGTLAPEAWILGAILFLWQFPHFYAIAWMYREDYERAGIKMLPVVEPDGESTARRIFWCALAMLPVSLLPRLWSMAGNWYALGALASGAAFLYYCSLVTADRSRSRARGVLLASVAYLPVLYGLLVIDHRGM